MCNKFTRWLMMPLVALVVTALGLIGVSMPQASASTYYNGTFVLGKTFGGNSYHPSLVRAGLWKNGDDSFCVDFDELAPNHASTIVLGATKTVPHMNAEQSAQAKYIANKYVGTKNANNAADAALAIWSLTNSAKFNGWYRVDVARGNISAWRQGQVKAILADAAQHAPYKMSVTASHQYVGQTGSGSATVLGSNGRPAVTRKVYISMSGGNVLTVNGSSSHTYGYTNKYGHVVFSYKRTSVSEATFRATLLTPSSYTATLSVSSSGHQRTLGGGYTSKASATYSYNLQAGLTMTSACSTDCNGLSTVTYKYCNPVGAKYIIWTEKASNGTSVTLRVTPGTCASKSVQLTDGTKVTSQYCYASTSTGGCVTGTVVLTKVFEVVCPAWEHATISVSCGCNTAKAYVTFTTPASTRFYTGTIVLGNKAGTLSSQTYTLVNGRSQTIAVPWTVSSGVTIEALFSVYRDAAHTQPLMVNKPIVEIMVMSTGSVGHFSTKTLQRAPTGAVRVK